MSTAQAISPYQPVTLTNYSRFISDRIETPKILALIAGSLNSVVLFSKHKAAAYPTALQKSNLQNNLWCKT